MNLKNMAMKSEIVEMFLLRNDVCKELNRVIFDGNGCAYASDGFMILRWQHSGESTSSEKGLIAARLFEGISGNLLTFRKSEYLEWLGLAGLGADNNDCPECHGEGLVTWTYGEYRRDDDCPVCDGSGLITHRMEFELSCRVYKLNGVLMTQKQADAIVRLMDEDGIDEVQLTFNASKNICYCKLSNCEMVFTAQLEK